MVKESFSLYRFFVLIVFCSIVTLTKTQEIKVNAGPDIEITCFDEIQLEVHLNNWIEKFHWTVGLQSIQFVDDTLAYAVGGKWDESLIVKTIDGGKTWKEQFSSAHTFLNKVHFLNRDTGFIVGGNAEGVVLKTINGGTDWEVKYTPWFEVRTIRFINDSVGYAAGRGPIIRTVDGGETWEELSTPWYSYFDLYFIDNLYGIALGRASDGDDWDGKLCITLDGGINWVDKDLHFAYTLYNATCNDSVVYIVTAEGMMLTSDDHFETWSVINTGVLPDLREIKFLNHDTAVIVGMHNTILTTTDRGMNWSREYSDYPGDLYSVAFITDKSRFIVGSSPSYLDNGGIMAYTPIPQNLIYNWSPQEYLSDPAKLSPTIYPLVSNEYIITVSDTNGLICADSIHVQVTTPGIYAGEDISISRSEPTQLHALAQIGRWEFGTFESRSWFTDVLFVNKDTGFITGSQISGMLMKTTDGGATWKKKITSASYGLYNISFPTEECGYVCGVYGSIYKTSDGGESWDSININTSENLVTIFFVTENIGFVGGENGAFFKSIDGGLTWEKLLIVTGKKIQKIYFLDENHGFASANLPNECSFFETFDGGISWRKRVITNRTFDIADIQFINDTVGIMIGSSFGPFGFLKTTDGGVTWEDYRVTSDGLTRYTSVFFTDEFTGYVCTGGGDIIKTVDGGRTWYLWKSFSDATLTTLYFRNEYNAVVVGPGFMAKYHAPSDIHFNWTPEEYIMNSASAHPFVFPAMNTTYLVEAYNGIGCSTMDDVNVTISPNGINENITFDEFNITIYPNPSTDFLFIEFKERMAGPFRLAIYDASGKIILEEELIPTTGERCLIHHEMNPGLYFVEVENSENKAIKKIIVQ